MLKIKVIVGDRSGETFSLRDGFRIGRAIGDLILNDGKVSSLHAYVKAGPKGELILFDNQSKNGLRVNGQRVSQVELSPQTTFQIGNSTLEVFADETPELPAFPAEVLESGPPPSKQAPPESGDAEPEQKVIEPEPMTWGEALVETLRDALPSIKNQINKLYPFTPTVRLYFARGVQVETSWLVGYGPRRFGARSVDLQIQEPGAPNVCFELLPDPKGVLFKTTHPEIVQINGVSQKSKLLSHGDTIKINETLVEVSFEP